jgi:integrase
MSIRKRTWKTAKGDAREAWVVDYVDQTGKRRLKTFKKKKEADGNQSSVRNNPRDAHSGLGQHHGCGSGQKMA